MEYVMYGKLLSFLRDHRTRAHYYNFSDATDALTSRDLTVFAYCVARGMDYLTNKSVSTPSVEPWQVTKATATVNTGLSSLILA